MDPTTLCEPGTLFRVYEPVAKQATMATTHNGDVVAVDGTIETLHHHGADRPLPTGRRLDPSRDGFLLLAPTTPSKIVCVGLNYAHHATEMDKRVPEEPLLFLKPPSALIGPGDAIELPPQSELVHHEGELAIIIGARSRDLEPNEAAGAIFGYTCACDVSARDIQRREGRYTRGKGFDTFAPLGPAIARTSDFRAADHRLTCRVNDEIRQQSTLDDFIFPIDRVVSFISRVMTLMPGDVIFTGTPAGVGPIVSGDRVQVEIDGIGTLQNPVINR